MSKSKSKSNNSEKFVGMGDWVSDPLDLKLGYFPANPVYSYGEFNLLSDDVKDISINIQSMRKAAEVHRQVRRFAQEMIKPGVRLLDICNAVEGKTVELFGQNDLKAGIGFPTGLSVNHIAAHDSANPGDVRVLGEHDVCKVDFGTHCNGYIIDSAFTVCFDHKFKPLLDASRDGTWTGIKMAGPDVRVNDVSKEIQEAIESYEIELDGKIYPIKAVKNLGGHNIEQYRIHAGKLILGAPHKSIPDSMKMRSGECYAIETFATTGVDMLNDDTVSPCNHFMKVYDTSGKDTKFRFDVTKKTFGYINKNRTTLPFANRWVNDAVGSSYNVGLSDLSKRGIVQYYPPLVGRKGDYVAQWEHTLYLHDYGKEILSKGDDY
jgi:methionyl aminopeptidase